MNTLEERVRAATRAAGDTVAPDSVPPLHLPSGDPAPFARGLAVIGFGVGPQAGAAGRRDGRGRAGHRHGEPEQDRAVRGAASSPAPSAPGRYGVARPGYGGSVDSFLRGVGSGARVLRLA